MSEWEDKSLSSKRDMGLEYGPTVGRDGHVRRAERDDGLKVFGRLWSDEQMREFDRKVDAMPLEPEMKLAAKRTLRRMQGLPYEEAVAGIDASVVEALRRLVDEFA